MDGDELESADSSQLTEFRMTVGLLDPDPSK